MEMWQWAQIHCKFEELPAKNKMSLNSDDIDHHEDVPS